MKIKDSLKTRYRASNIRYTFEKDYAKNVTKDPRKDIRILSRKCEPCYYAQVVVCHAFRPYTCICCDGSFQHPNSNIPLMCAECAKENNLCAQCGCDVNYD